MGLLEELEDGVEVEVEILDMKGHGTESQREIGLRFGLCQQAVSRIVRREGW